MSVEPHFIEGFDDVGFHGVANFVDSIGGDSVLVDFLKSEHRGLG